MMHLNLFLMGCGHHAAAWRHPDAQTDRLADVEYCVELAQLSETGLLDAVFFADGHTVSQVEHGSWWFLEPLTALAAVATRTERIGLVTTVSSTFYTPFHAARYLSSLDHISRGRVGANIVTSMWDAEARNHSLASMPDHAQRYARADEFIQVLHALWDSWADDAVIADRQGIFADPQKVRPIHHAGEHFQVDGPLTLPRSPQGRPVLFQAGASDTGRDLAARWAEAIYAVAFDSEAGREYADDVRRRITRAGRDASRVAILPGLVTYVGSTEGEALRKKAELDSLLPVEHSLSQLSLFTEQDASGWDVDAPIPPLPPAEAFAGPQGRYRTILRMIEVDTVDGVRPTVRQVLGRLAAGGGHATMIGTPESIADEMQRWCESGAADGFNLMPPLLPGSLEDFIDHVVPVLQQRGLFRTAYDSHEHTLRDRLGLPRPASHDRTT